MIPILMVVAAVCAFGLAASLTFTWASGKSAFWNIGFGTILVMIATTVLMIATALATRRFSR